ncbi:MAG: hypothetical protein IJG53_04720 [Eggerthellaceae bacterium]|nr:hypothetical protein [Eggerthellaceae bacterium]
MYYLIGETLEPCTADALPGATRAANVSAALGTVSGEPAAVQGGAENAATQLAAAQSEAGASTAAAATRPFVAVLTPEEWNARESAFDMGIDFEPDINAALDTQAEENYDSITGTIFIPDRANPDGPEARFAFALDEKGVVFIDAGGDEGVAANLVKAVANGGKRRNPCLEQFLAAFVSQIIRQDPRLLRRYERELDALEDEIMADKTADDNHIPTRITEMRDELRDLDDHYEHLMDLAEVWEDNENGFFTYENLRYFRLLYGRLDKLRDQAATLREQALQMLDLYKMRLDLRTNHIMTVLTVVTAIFAPLTLIAGWYGMNFANMPELTWKWGYPLVFVLCLVIAVACLLFFKRKKWL